MFKYPWSKQQDERREERRPKPVKKFTLIANESKKRAKENKEYRELRKEFLKQNPICQMTVCCLHDKSTQVHHSKGRIGDLINDIRFFIACCNDCHKWAEENPIQAKELGISLSRLNK